MPVNVAIDSKRRLVNCEFWGPVAGQEFIDSLTTALRSNPELADYDAVCDVARCAGNVTTDDLASVAMLMNDLRTDRRRLARTALITHDCGYATWAQVMAHQFERRRFDVFDTRAAAEAWLQTAPQDLEAA